MLIGQSSTLGLPAPYWFIVLFKVLGFTLHFVPMSLWFAGIITAMVAGRIGTHGPTLSRRLMNQMPLIISAGVNLGIVPLLFVQVAYYKVFYPATVLMAWPWLAIIALLCVAYYGVYVYAIGLRRGTPLNGLTRACGWVAAVLFIAMGYLYTAGFSLMIDVGAWPALYESTSVGGAPLGIAMHGGMYAGVRFMMAFGLSFIVLASYLFLDAKALAGRESAEYRGWASGAARNVAILGLLVFAIGGFPYIFVATPDAVRSAIMAPPHLLFAVLAMALPVVAAALVVLGARAGQGLAWLAALVMFLAVGANAIVRQVVQNLRLAEFVDVAAEPVNTQLSPLILFLLLFVAGLGVVAWMVAKVVQVNRRETAQDGK
jgi:hypothetical protein